MTVQVLRTERKTLSISVFPDGFIEVRAPLGASDEEISARVRRRRRWIARQHEFFAQFKPRTPERQYVSGETHLYLGRQYRLKVLSGTKKPVRLWAGYLEVTLPDESAEAVRRALQSWYRQQADRHFELALQKVRKDFHRGLPGPITVEARAFSKRWGTCHTDGRIVLNTDLVRAPRSCIEYVLLHELCHLLVPDHSRAFFRILEGHLPEWRTRKLILERMLS
jgi:hypothetical protein